MSLRAERHEPVRFWYRRYACDDVIIIETSSFQGKSGWKKIEGSEHIFLYGSEFFVSSEKKGEKHENKNIQRTHIYRYVGALSTVLMMINFPIPFAPTFLKFDIAELPALFAGFFLGPLSGALVVVVKILLKLVIQGTETAFVGEFSNLVGSCCFVLIASFIYKKHRTKKGAIVGMCSSSLFVSVLFIFNI